jgi:hypothetical protein
MVELLEERTQLGAWAFMEYFILKPDGEQTGTFSLEQVRAMLNSGFLDTESRYWHEGIADWQPIERIEESINYPEPDPHQLHAPPAPQKWTGSLARAIPSPNQLRQKSGPVAITNTPIFAEVPIPPATPAVPAPLRSAADIPTSTLRVESTPASNGTTAHEPAAPTISRERAVAEAPREEPRAPFRFPRIPMPNATQVCALGLILLVAAIIAAVVASRHPAKSAFSEVTVTLHNNCVLTTQSAIRSFGLDMHDQRHSISIARLKDLVAKSTDPAFIQTAGISLQQAILKYESDVTRDYVQDGKAEIIEPGTYRTVAYFDDGGGLVVAHAGATWAAILYKGAVVYAYLGADYEPRAE